MMSETPSAPDGTLHRVARLPLEQLALEGRCVFRPRSGGVWTHSLKGQMDRLRIDYMWRRWMAGHWSVWRSSAARNSHPTWGGRWCNVRNTQPRSSRPVGRRIETGMARPPLRRYFCASISAGCVAHLATRRRSRASLRPGECRVAYVTQHNGLNLNIGGDRWWWCERWGYRANSAMDRTARVGNGNWKPEA